MFDIIKTIIGIVLVIIIIAVILFYLGLFVTASQNTLILSYLQSLVHSVT